MNILGLHLGHDSAAALIVDDRLVAMVEKERLTRTKYDRGYSDDMVAYVLKSGGIRAKDIDYVVVSIPSGCGNQPSVRPSDLHGINITRGNRDYINGPRQLNPWHMDDGITVEFMGVRKPGYQVQHHLAHVASSYYLSNFNNAIGLSYDASYWPDNQTSMICTCDGNRVEVRECPMLNAGIAYDQVTRTLFGDWQQAGKTMGLAAYGRFKHGVGYIPMSISTLMINIGYFWRVVLDEHIDEWRQNAAARVQQWLNADVVRVLDHIRKHYRNQNIVTSGGTVLNVIANRIIYDNYDGKMFCSPFPKDSGIAAGGALYVLHHVHNKPRQHYTSDQVAFMGMDTDKEEVAPYKVAQKLADDKVVFWHWGSSEVGPRALGHRSILASPFTDDMKQRVSQRIKGREWFRPLAPIVKADKVSDWFDIKQSPMSDFMLISAKVKSDRLKAVTHFDGTARVQTVGENHILYPILDEFEHLTSCPVLINTSLNIRGQAICETEADTLWTLQNSDGDIAYVNGTEHKK